ncbi:DUF4911 domain-containing protein [Candidatus Sumerlaeota bacterium]|nr:DUF4911 domain-containing protein [Candidatus Sumerlaeota bacterium]
MLHPSKESSRWDRLPACERRCRTYRAQVRTDRIGYVNAVLESYDVLARIQTEEIRRGLLAITVPEDWDSLFRSVMRALGDETGVRLLDEGVRDDRK